MITKLSEHKNIDLSKPITLIATDGTVEVEADLPHIATITPADTVKFAQEMTEADFESLKKSEHFMKYFNIVFKGEIKLTASLAKYESMGIQHVIGMIVLIAKAIAEEKTPYLKHPESYLHPKFQAQLADMVIAFNPGNIREKNQIQNL